VIAFHSPARALAAGLPRQDHVYSTADESFRVHNKKIDEMRCKLDSTENPRNTPATPPSDQIPTNKQTNKDPPYSVSTPTTSRLTSLFTIYIPYIHAHTCIHDLRYIYICASIGVSA